MSQTSTRASTRILTRMAALKAAKRKALIPFVTAGDPDKAFTVPLMHAMVKAGADIIELGVPFSDPMADGPVIQRAGERALKNGVGLRDVLAMTAEFRKQDTTTPVVLMGYANPIERMGIEAFAAAARDAGADGVIVVDYPPEESEAFAALMQSHGLDPIFLLAPTTTDARIAAICKAASGYIYYVSLKGVTGAGHLDTAEVARKVSHIRKFAGDLPVGVGFGIRDGATARAISESADAVVIGSRIVQEIEASPREAAIGNVAAFLAGVRAALDAPAAPTAQAA
jgi:tryptophan synthase alpha chain